MKPGRSTGARSFSLGAVLAGSSDERYGRERSEDDGVRYEPVVCLAERKTLCRKSLSGAESSTCSRKGDRPR